MKKKQPHKAKEAKSSSLPERYTSRPSEASSRPPVQEVRAYRRSDDEPLPVGSDTAARSATAPTKAITIAAGELLQALKNTRAWLERNKLHCPPIKLDGIDQAIEAAEKAGIKGPTGPSEAPPGP